MPTPGIYAINSTGETVALLLEDGSGDQNLLEEILEEEGYALVDQEEVVKPALGVLGKILVNLGLSVLCAAAWVTFGIGVGLAAVAAYLLLLGYSYQQRAGVVA